MRISDWSSDVCSSDLLRDVPESQRGVWRAACNERRPATEHGIDMLFWRSIFIEPEQRVGGFYATRSVSEFSTVALLRFLNLDRVDHAARSAEHTSELQSLMRHSYAALCLKKKKI